MTTNPNPAADPIREAVAEAIYDAMRENDPEGRNRPWVPRGNSDKQDEARRRAARALAATPTPEVPDYTPSGLRNPTLDELNGGPRRTDLPMLRPAPAAPDRDALAKAYRIVVGLVEEALAYGMPPHVEEGLAKGLERARLLASGILAPKANPTADVLRAAAEAVILADGALARDERGAEVRWDTAMAALQAALAATAPATPRAEAPALDGNQLEAAARAAFVVRDVAEWSRLNGQPIFDDATLAALGPLSMLHIQRLLTTPESREVES